MQIGTIASGRCLLIIPTPKDELVYGCFRSIAQQWQHSVTGESLWIEGNVPIRACLTTASPSDLLERLRGASQDIIARIEVRFGGLLLAYERSGGQGPALYRKSFFDEVRAECRGPASLDALGLLEVFRTLTTCLNARRGMSTRELLPLLAQASTQLTLETEDPDSASGAPTDTRNSP